MKLLSAAQIREADAYTIAHEPIASIDLMERAAQACTNWLLSKFQQGEQFVIVCGNGNNGGDGLAIARQLHNAQRTVDVLVLRVSTTDSPDFTTNLQRLYALEWVAVHELNDLQEFPQLDATQLVCVDAIFGSGLNRKPEDKAAALIHQLNFWRKSAAIPIVSIDMPSGMSVDDQRELGLDCLIESDFILTFQAPKLNFFLIGGNWIVLDIGLHPDFMRSVQTPFHATDAREVATLLHTRQRFSHKGTFGHALVIAGSTGKTGAAVLAARGALRAGAGLVSVLVPQRAYSILQTSVPEAMVHESAQADVVAGAIPPGRFEAVGVGPGLGTNEDTQRFLKQLIQECQRPLVLDADALNILSENKTWMAFLPKETILTPHPGEFDRLTGDRYITLHDRLLAARDMAVRFGVYIILKGAYTAVAFPDGSIHFNTSGNPGMATGGSGDALTGILTGLLAQGYSAAHACLLGVYLHGLAGDIAASVHGQEAMLASDLIEQIGGAYRMLREQK